MQQQELKDFMKVLTQFDHAMLVTESDAGLRARPMAIGDVTPDGRVRFITSDDSIKLDELTDRPHVNVTCQGDRRFLSISGDARLSKERELIDQAWKSNQSTWFAEGKDDPRVVALEIIPSFAEFWDRSEPTSLFSRVFGVNTEEAAEHGDIDFSDKPL